MKRLHTEIEQLKSANRDLQFQLVLLHQENQDHLAYSTASEDNQNHSTDSKKKKTMYEFDFGSRHCLLQLKCERCQQYTPLRVNCIKPDGKLKGLLGDANPNEIFGPPVEFDEKKENLLSAANSYNRSPITGPGHKYYRPNQISDHYSTNHYSMNQSCDQPYNMNNQPHTFNQGTAPFSTPNNTHPDSPIAQRPFPLQRPSPAALTSPIVHKTYVLSIQEEEEEEAADQHPLSKPNKKKIQKTIVWSKRQSLETPYETEKENNIDGPPCILPPLQHWQESTCTSAVKKIQPSNSTPTLPEIFSKK
uniref:Uncharacterized protein n=2 Tax=Cacopsylla melanoneura TaxID=428564 RepID=A0A8D8QD74_9HEMI